MTTREGRVAGDIGVFAALDNWQAVAAARQEVGYGGIVECRSRPYCEQAGRDSDLPGPSSADTLAFRCNETYQRSMGSCLLS